MFVLGLIVYSKLVYLPWAELISFFEFFNILAENLPTLLASKNHLGGFLELMVLGELVALWAVEPFSAAWGPDGHLSVNYVLAHSNF